MSTEFSTPHPAPQSLTHPTPGHELPARERFLQLLAQALDDDAFVKLSLAGWAGAQPEPGLTLQRLLVRPIMLRGAATLQLVWRFDTRDTTKNHALREGLQVIADALGEHSFETAHLEWRDTPGSTRQAEFRHKLKGGRDKSRVMIAKAVPVVAKTMPVAAKAVPVAGNVVPKASSASPTAAAANPAAANRATATRDAPDSEAADAASPWNDGPAAYAAEHNRIKHRPLSLDLPCWADLGLTTPGPQPGTQPGTAARLVPAMARKWKQINRYIEIVGAAFGHSALAQQPQVRVLDFGSGKGYLTFAMHAWLSAQGKRAEVTGVELRTGLVELCNASARRHGLDGLSFNAGDVRSYAPDPVDVMIALHACDTATDHAIHLGLRAGAQLIVCSPCCHKQLRPQMTSPALLRPMLQHGIHLGQQAEMVTDSLRALLLDAAGYDTQVFEFIALEHTSKNKMILAVKRPHEQPGHAEAVMQQVDEIKAFYGVTQHCLQDLMLQDSGVAR